MKILIHGRKNGYTVLFPKPTPTEFYSFASDIQSISANNDDVYYGKMFYTLAFTDEGYVYTKYVIGDDVERGQLGEIGISVFIPNTQNLSGADVKILLDELINTYNQNYIINNKIDEPKTNFNWLLFTSIADRYDKKLLSCSTCYDIVKTGAQDPAFHYYKSESELILHLDEPFQEEYSDYRQILFIGSNLQGPGNPLNVIKNSGVEVNPDLNNKYYFLNNYSHSRGVIITANGKPRSDKKGENQIRAKWQVEIKYSKDYHKPIVVTGSISDPDISKYLEINGNNIKIKYDAFQPEPETRTFTFDVITKKDGVKVTDAEIQIDTNPWQHLSKVTFKAEELGREHKIAARKGDNLFSDVIKITQKNYSEDSISLPLIEKRVVKVTATDQENGDAIWKFKVHVTDKDFYKVTSEIEFVGDEIDKEWNIQIEKREEYSDSENRKFCPAKDGNEIHFKLKKRPIKSSKSNYNDYPLHDNEEKQKSFTEKAKSFFYKPAVIKTLIVGALALVGIWALYYYLDNEHTLNKENIERYVEGNSLYLDTLNDYKENWEKQEQNFIPKSGGGIFGGNENTDSTKWENDWKPAYESINKAIKKRELIDEKNFEKIKNLHYSAEQQSFETAIKKIDSTKYTEVGQRLGYVSTLTLTQIADSINAILTQKKQKEKEKQAQPQEQKKEEKGKVQKDEPEYITRYLETSPDFQPDSIKKYYAVSGLSNDLNNSLRIVKDFINGGYVNCKTLKKNTSNDKFLKTNPNLERWVDKVCKDSQGSTKSQVPASRNITTEITEYIKGSELDETKLKEYKNTEGVNQNLKKSIQLCLDFWALDGLGSGKNSKTYWTFRDKVNVDANFNNSKLKAFLDKMCQKGTKPSYSKQDKIKGLK